MQKLQDINVKAVGLGLLADVGGTFLFSLIFGIIGVLLLVSTGRDIKELEEFAKTRDFFYLMTVAGLIFTGVGGYVAGRVAKKAEILNALTMGVISVLLGGITGFFSKGTSFLIFDIIAMILTLTFAFAGGYVCIKLKEAAVRQDK